MAFSLLNDSISDRVVGALCNTLVHSLWQGILLAVLAGLIVVCTRKASSALRYNLLIATLLLFAIGVAATFAWQYQKTVVLKPAAESAQYVPANIAPANIDIQDTQQATLSFTDRLNNYLVSHHDTIVLIWFLIICARSLQLAFGLYSTSRLKKVRVKPVTGHWSERMQQLAGILNIRQTITLLESGLAKVPMVIGYLKPVILVPVGLLAAIPADELEAILVHELAHIKRRDYLVNLLQSLVEIIFFFNPAVLWVSKLIKAERENCCDDLAINQNNNKVNYIRALISCEEYQSTVPAYAMALTGRNTLIGRVKRMLSNRNHSLNLFEKTVLAVCLVAFGLGMTAFTAREHIKQTLHLVAAAIHREPVIQKAGPAKSDTTQKKHPAPVSNVNGLLNKLHQLNPDTLKLTGSTPLNMVNQNLDSLKWAANTLSLQKNKNALSLLSMLDTISGNRNKATAKTFHNIGLELYREHLIVDTNHMNISLNERELVVNGVRMPEQVHARIYRQFGNRFGAKGGNGNHNSNFTDKSADSEMAYANNDTVHHNNMAAYSSSSSGSATGYSADSYQYGSASADYQLLNKERQKYWAEQQKKMIADLLKDGLITDPKNMSFSLSDKKLIVNGKEQSEDIYQRYTQKYNPNKDKGGHWNWNYSNHE